MSTNRTPKPATKPERADEPAPMPAGPYVIDGRDTGSQKPWSRIGVSFRDYENAKAAFLRLQCPSREYRVTVEDTGEVVLAMGDL